MKVYGVAKRKTKKKVEEMGGRNPKLFFVLYHSPLHEAAKGIFSFWRSIFEGVLSPWRKAAQGRDSPKPMAYRAAGAQAAPKRDSQGTKNKNSEIDAQNPFHQKQNMIKAFALILPYKAAVFFI